MTNEVGMRELIFVMVLMFFLLLLGVGAMYLFYRQWKREQAARADKNPAPKKTPEV